MSAPRLLTEADGLTKAEADTMAFLNRAGCLSHDRASVDPLEARSSSSARLLTEADGLTKAEADTMALLNRAGCLAHLDKESAHENTVQARWDARR